MKALPLMALLMAGLLMAVPTRAQIEFTDYPPCLTVGEWDPPGAVRAGPEEDGIRISWIPSPTEPFEVEGYEISRASDLEGPYEPVAIVETGIDEYVDQATVPDIIYWYRVRSYRGGLCSPLSEPVQESRR